MVVRRKKEDVKKEFESFARKISKLESLKHELDALDTRDFRQEAKVIKIKLKDVNSLPEVEEDVENLRRKIMCHSSKRAVKSKIAKKLIEKSNSMEKDRQLMKSKIEELEKNISDKIDKLSRKKAIPDEFLREIKEVPELERKVVELRKDFKEHSKAQELVFQ